MTVRPAAEAINYQQGGSGSFYAGGIQEPQVQEDSGGRGNAASERGQPLCHRRLPRLMQQWAAGLYLQTLGFCVWGKAQALRCYKLSVCIFQTDLELTGVIHWA